MRSLWKVLFLLFLSIQYMFGQINKEHTHLRGGDILLKQQVEYVDPGEPGPNKVWDFSRLNTINNEYKLTYSLPPLQDDSLYIMGDYRFNKKEIMPGELIIGTEHHTMYYYQQKGDSLLLLGHENPTVRLQYSKPVIQLLFPAGYGQADVVKDYKAEGLYSSTVPISSQGDITLGVDAFGKMILPTGDTLNPVVRIIHIKTFTDENHNTEKILETHSWYTKGYRYPIFETVKNINAKDSTVIFSTAFYYPLQDHYYLSTDPENQALLDEIWDMKDRRQTIKTQKIDIQTDNIIQFDKVYPNPVRTDLNIMYILNQKERVQIQLVSTGGNIVRRINKKTQDIGQYQDVINCTGLMSGTYHLKLIAGQQIISQTIIKK